MRIGFPIYAGLFLPNMPYKGAVKRDYRFLELLGGVNVRKNIQHSSGFSQKMCKVPRQWGPNTPWRTIRNASAPCIVLYANNIGLEKHYADCLEQLTVRTTTWQGTLLCSLLLGARHLYIWSSHGNSISMSSLNQRNQGRSRNCLLIAFSGTLHKVRKRRCLLMVWLDTWSAPFSCFVLG